MAYTIKKSTAPLVPGAAADHPQWQAAEELTIDYVFAQSSDHHPRTTVKVLHDGSNIGGIFTVDDCYVIGKTTQDQQQVCLDSCVEFFFHPQGDERYFNLEMSCNGHILLYHITNCRKGIFDELPLGDLRSIVRNSTLPKRVDPEITTPTKWSLSFYFPMTLVVKHAPQVSMQLSGQHWHGNFTKCANNSSHPHWISWQKLSKLEFHSPLEFGEIIFE